MMNLRDREGLEQITRDMDFMCSEVGRRLAGSPEEERVADYVLERFEALGLTNIAKLPFACKRWLPGEAALSIVECAAEGTGKLAPGTSIQVQQVTHTPATPTEGVEGELLYFEPVDWESGLRREDLEGKIGLFWGSYGESADAFSQLHQSGLKALLFVNTRLQTDWPPADGVGEKYMSLIRKPMAYVSMTDAWALARERVSRVRFSCDGRTEDATSWNAVGELAGGDPEGRIIVASSHIDSVSVGVGADDNASGTAAILECARRLREESRRHTFRFIGFGAEEQLSVGSTRYIKEQVQDLDRIDFTCNFDGIAALMGLSSVMCTGTPELEKYVNEIVETRLRFGETSTEVSPYQDQFWFTARGIPGLWFGRTTHPGGFWYHHSEHNSLDQISMEQIAWTAEAACEMLAELGSTDQWPFERQIPEDLQKDIDRYLREIF